MGKLYLPNHRSISSPGNEVQGLFHGRCFSCAKVRLSGSCKAQWLLPPCIRSRLSALALARKNKSLWTGGSPTVGKKQIV
ncbi:hypothetical protein AAH103_04080 [Phocaeicola vulgatus]|uniref:hypothetical protein n=1 Tax=Phocaeicola vulgatus TaxID=821 RepID=UPI0039B5F08B